MLKSCKPNFHWLNVLDVKESIKTISLAYIIGLLTMSIKTFGMIGNLTKIKENNKKILHLGIEC